MAGQQTHPTDQREQDTQRCGVRAHAHRIASVCLVALGVFGIVESSKLGLGDLTEPGPGLWPLVLSTVVVGSAAVLFVVDDPRDYERWSGRSAMIGAGIVGLAAYIVAFSLLGFAISTALLIGVWLRVFARESWRSTIVLTVAGAVALYLIFAVLLNVPFPEGVLAGGAA